MDELVDRFVALKTLSFETEPIKNSFSSTGNLIVSVTLWLLLNILQMARNQVTVDIKLLSLPLLILSYTVYNSSAKQWCCYNTEECLSSRATPWQSLYLYGCTLGSLYAMQVQWCPIIIVFFYPADSVMIHKIKKSFHHCLQVGWY